MTETVNQTSPYSGNRFLQKLLTASVCIMGLTIVFYTVYSESGRLPTSTYAAVIGKTRSTRKTLDLSVRNLAIINASNFVYRRVLTKSDYPFTVSAPFVIENQHICDGNVTVLIVAKSSTINVYKRSLIRQSFGNVNLFTAKYNVRIMFTLGLVDDNTTNDIIKLENSLYHDIVQGGFEDTYRNLTLKGVMAYKWISLHCSHAELILTIDDDTFVNIFKVLENYLPLIRGEKNILMCNIMHPSKIIRGVSVLSPGLSKWKVDADFFRGEKYFPPYCSGFSVFMSADVPKALWEAAHFTPFFWIDDVYLTGLLPPKYRIPLRALNQNVSVNPGPCLTEFESNDPKFVSCVSQRDQQFTFFWNRTLVTISPTMRQLVNENFVNETLEERTSKLNWLHNWIF